MSTLPYVPRWPSSTPSFPPEISSTSRRRPTVERGGHHLRGCWRRGGRLHLSLRRPLHGLRLHLTTSVRDLVPVAPLVRSAARGRTVVVRAVAGRVVRAEPGRVLLD